MDCLSRHAKLSTQGADACLVIICYECKQLCTRNMDARARARVPVFEKAHARMKRIHITCNGKYTENCWAETETLPKELAGLH